ncbi:MAG: folate-binding protein YgfZ [Magnetococcales bacterium]|nr:folate-binding protein YgfZ [Magnetococcales bacterium]
MSLLEPHLNPGIAWTTDRGKTTPLHFGDPEAELQGLLVRCGCVDFSHRGTVVLSGMDRTTFLGGLVTNQVKDLRPDRCLYTAMLSPQGRFQWDFTLLDHGETVVLDTEPDAVDALVSALNFYRLRSKVAIEVPQQRWGILGVVGPDAGYALAKVFPGIDFAGASLGTVWPLDEQLKIWRDPRHPAFGFRLRVPGDGFFDLWQRMAAVAPAAGCVAWETCRIINALPRGGAEWLPGETLPLEAGALEMNAVSFQKGCYVGQETTARTHHRGTLKKRLFHLSIDGVGELPLGTPVVLPSGREVGAVTSIVVHGGGLRGLAVLRLSDVATGLPLTALGRAVSVRKPEWATWELS